MLTILNISLWRKKPKTEPSPPSNYKKVDEFVSRSAQPLKDEFVWLKNQGVTDVVNFRTSHDRTMPFDESKVLKRIKINYHNIPTGARHIDESNIENFFKLVNEIRNSDGKRKLHLHCQVGADRTGFFSFLYKGVFNIDTLENNSEEMLKMGYHQKTYPELIENAKKWLSKRTLSNLKP